jgi:hypothetical protein
MVHLDIPHDFNGYALHRGLKDSLSNYRRGSFRYRFFFLPSGIAKEYYAHYSGEIEARDILWR